MIGLILRRAVRVMRHIGLWPSIGDYMRRASRSWAVIMQKRLCGGRSQKCQHSCLKCSVQQDAQVARYGVGRVRVAAEARASARTALVDACLLAPTNLAALAQAATIALSKCIPTHRSISCRFSGASLQLLKTSR